MNYQPFHMTRIGASHIRGNRPCQDASASESFHGAQIAVVADGHGSRRHFRSDRGSFLACKVALESIHVFLEKYETSELSMEEQLTHLKQQICDEWMKAVCEDFEQEPWTESELDEERKLLSEEQFSRLEDGSDAAIAYGSTVLAVFFYEHGWAAIQLGDGGFTHISPDGVYDWLMPESIVNEGNRTASLCMNEPMRDFRHCYGEDHPVALLVYTDGIEKIFPPQGKEIMSLLHWIWRNEYTEVSVREQNLVRTLDMLTSRSVIGDDVSIAGLFDPEAEDSQPVAGHGQQMLELDRLTARLAELESTISYNKKQLRQVSFDFFSRSDIKEQVNMVLHRNQEAASELRKRIMNLQKELGMVTDAVADTEPEPVSESEEKPEKVPFPVAEPETEEETEQVDRKTEI